MQENREGTQLQVFRIYKRGSARIPPCLGLQSELLTRMRADTSHWKMLCTMALRPSLFPVESAGVGSQEQTLQGSEHGSESPKAGLGLSCQAAQQLPTLEFWVRAPT